MKLLRVLMVLIMFLFLIGCEQERKTSWKIDLIKPDGTVHQSYTLESRRKPYPNGTYGGFIILYNDNNNTGIYAPAGWLIEVNEE